MMLRQAPFLEICMKKPPIAALLAAGGGDCHLLCAIALDSGWGIL
jgi:hypothetical protein